MMAIHVEALEQAIADTIDALPAQWVLVVADTDGQVHSLCSPNMPLWQRAGLLRWEADGFSAQPLWTLEGDDEDDNL